MTEEIKSKPGLVKAFKACSEDVQAYFSHIPKLLDDFQMDVCLNPCTTMIGSTHHDKREGVSRGNAAGHNRHAGVSRYRVMWRFYRVCSSEKCVYQHADDNYQVLRKDLWLN
jgi:hypothetical protein